MLLNSLAPFQSSLGVCGEDMAYPDAMVLVSLTRLASDEAVGHLRVAEYSTLSKEGSLLQFSPL